MMPMCSVILWTDSEIITNIKEDSHRWIVNAVFNVVDITGALSERQTHIPCGNTFFQPQINQALDKLILFSNSC